MRKILLLGAALTLLAPTVAFAQYGGDDGALSVDDTNPDPGEELTFNVNDDTFEPGSTVGAFLLSEPIELGTFTANEAGGLTGKVTIPDDVEPGAHTLELRGTGPDGEPKTVSIALTVAGAADEELAATGPSSVGGMLRTAALVLIVGLTLVGIAINRQKARTTIDETVSV